jgi:hypothetical protein
MLKILLRLISREDMEEEEEEEETSLRKSKSTPDVTNATEGESWPLPRNQGISFSQGRRERG